MTRRKYIVDPETLELVEVSPDYTSAPRTIGAPVTDLYMDGVRAVDGTDIGSRAKRRAYMQSRGLADADDFKGVWAKAEAERRREAEGRGDATQIKHDIARVIAQQRSRR